MNHSEGLPNIGNTCFLNSVLQGLYAAKNFRNQILSQKSIDQKMSFHLQKVFNAMRQKNSRQKKITILLKLIQFLSKKMNNYRGRTQQDASEFLLQILNKLYEQNKKYLQYFQFDSLFKCLNNKCSQEFQIENQIIYSARQINCSNPECFNSKVSIILKRAPQILIISDQFFIIQEISLYTIQNQLIQNNSQNQKLYLSSKIKNNRKNQQYQCVTKIQYQLKSVILYRGNKSHGHYVCLRASDQFNKKYKLTNDIWVSQEMQLHQFSLPNFIPLISVYQRKKSNLKIQCFSNANFDYTKAFQNVNVIQSPKFNNICIQQMSPKNQFQNTCRGRPKWLNLNQMTYQYRQQPEKNILLQDKKQEVTRYPKSGKIYQCSLI